MDWIQVVRDIGFPSAVGVALLVVVLRQNKALTDRLLKPDGNGNNTDEAGALLRVETKLDGIASQVGALSTAVLSRPCILHPKPPGQPACEWESRP